MQHVLKERIAMFGGPPSFSDYAIVEKRKVYGNRAFIALKFSKLEQEAFLLWVHVRY
jgi:hypothetical protein